MKSSASGPLADGEGLEGLFRFSNLALGVHGA